MLKEKPLKPEVLEPRSPEALDKHLSAKHLVIVCGFEPWSHGTCLKKAPRKNLNSISVKGVERVNFLGSPNFQLRYPIGERLQSLER
jgi:hypothetical protein